MQVGRYHSLAVEVEKTSNTTQTDDGEIMGIEHVTLPIFGIQFHPESILTPQGPTLISNFYVVHDDSIHIFLMAYFLGCSTPCENKLSTSSSLYDLFVRLDTEQCLHSQDIDLLRQNLREYHHKTTLHCDEIWRRSSIDGKLFDGPQELVLSSGSVPDVHIEPDGTHVIVYNNTDPEMLLTKTLQDPQIFWRMGLVGFGGLGIALDRMNGNGLTFIETDLHLQHPQEVVDPDIGKTPTGQWRLVWFGVDPKGMDENLTGPINAPKPHYFYRSTSYELSDLGKPTVILASNHGEHRRVLILQL